MLESTFVNLLPTLLPTIQRKAAELVGVAGFEEHDREDLEQEFLLDQWIRFHRYDPTRSSPLTFAMRLANNKAATLIESRRAQCRDHRRCQDSLNDRVPGESGGWIERQETISEPEYFERWGRPSYFGGEALDLRIDLARAASKLPLSLVRILDLLLSDGPTEIARQLGCSRITVYRRLGRIRIIFDRACLSEYLPSERRVYRKALKRGALPNA